MADYFLAAAKELGALITSHTLEDLKFAGCIKCMGCKTKSDRCVLDDGLSHVLDEIALTDVLVLSTGVYYGDTTGDLCAFESRTFSLLQSDYEDNPARFRMPSGKILVFIMAQGAPAPGYVAIYERFKKIFISYGFSECHLINADAIHFPGDVRNRNDIIAATKELAKKICSMHTSQGKE